MWESMAQVGTISDRIERQVIELIGSERLKPGDRLPSERALTALLGVSRPSVREAVKSLEARGTLVVRHGQGVFVASPQSQRDLRAALVQQEVTLAELFAMRELLEVQAAGWAATARDDVRLSAAEIVLKQLTTAVATQDPDFELLQRLDAAFHLRIVEAAGNRFLNQTLGVLQQMIAAGMETTLRLPGRLARSHEEHRKLMAALAAGNASAARQAARRHIRRAHSAALARLASQLDAASPTVPANRHRQPERVRRPVRSGDWNG